MSARTKKHHTHKKHQIQTVKQAGRLSEIMIKSPIRGIRSFDVPNKVVSNIISIVKDYEKEGPIDWRKAFSKEIEKLGESSLALKGARAKENMTQKKLAHLLGTSQVYISQLENGQKEINKQMAKKLEKIFNINYKVFL